MLNTFMLPFRRESSDPYRHCTYTLYGASRNIEDGPCFEKWSTGNESKQQRKKKKKEKEEEEEQEEVGDETVKEKCKVQAEEKGEKVSASCRAHRPVCILQDINSLQSVIAFKLFWFERIN